MILTIRTDKPEAEVGVYGTDGQELSYIIWQAHRELSTTLLATLRDGLAEQHAKFADCKGLIVFTGPGSFTGLRIGITVANSLAYALGVPIVGAQGQQWQADGLSRLSAGENDRLVLPQYGSEAHITPARK